MVKTKCAICGKDDSRELYPANFDSTKIDARIFSARRLPDKIHYRIVKCNRCGLIYSNPILPPEKIENLYRESKVTYDEHTGNLAQTYGFYLKRVEKYLVSLKDSKPLRLLEIGCGNGFFLEKAKEMGYAEVWGVEPGKQSVAVAPDSIRNNIIVDIFRPNLFRANFFDVVCILQTLDHLVDPNTALAESHRILKKGGIILAIVHDVSSWQAKLLGEHSPIIDIEHTYLYDPKTLPMNFRKNRFEVLDMFDVVNINTLGYWIYLAPLPAVIKKSTLSLIGALRLETIPLRLKAGNIGIIARKPTS